MDLSETTYSFWFELEATIRKYIPNHIKNTFHLCGYSNALSFQNFDDDDIEYVETFVRMELQQILYKKFKKINVVFDEQIQKLFFGEFVSDITAFMFLPDEKKLIKTMAERLNEANEIQLNPSIIKEISNDWKSKQPMYFDQPDRSGMCTTSMKSIPPGSINLLEKLTNVGEKNAQRPVHGYRYTNEVKRFAVYQRTLAGPLAYKTLQSNAIGLLPSISATNKYIYRPENVIIEGQLMCEELLVYLQDNKQPLWVALSEDGTRIDNRIQYDARTNQLIGFVLPMDKTNGMPQPFVFKARNADEILSHFTSGTSVSSFVNTIMAKPMGRASSYCLLIFGTDNKHTAEDVSRRWNHIVKDLKRIGIGVLSISSDSDPKFNCGMRRNSMLGWESPIFPENSFFKCGSELYYPFYFQDFPHIGTKLRNLLLKTIGHPKKLPFGHKYFITMDHLRFLLDNFGKDQNLLTKTTLNPNDRQNFSSVCKICDRRVINLLKLHVSDSNGTVMFLEIISDSITAFMDENLLPLERIGKVWHALFLTRIWRYFVLKNSKYTLKDNFMSSNCFTCLEQNAHSMVLISLFLNEQNLPELFIPLYFCSQPCEAFFRQVRSLSSTYSTVVTCSVKEIVNRISKIQLQSEIGNDSESGFVYPKSLKSIDTTKNRIYELPSKDDIIECILKIKTQTLESAKEIGLIDKSDNSEHDEACFCRIAPYVPKKQKFDESSFFSIDETESLEIYMQLNAKVSLKNYADQFKNKVIEETSPYVEIPSDRMRFVVRKTSLCWLLRKDPCKLSSDRLLRVRGGVKNKTKKCKKLSK